MLSTRTPLPFRFAALLLAAALFGPALPAHADDGAEGAEESPGFAARLEQGVDQFFGEWIVGPLATVFFYDVVFWDDPPAHGDRPEGAIEVPTPTRTEAGWILHQVNGAADASALEGIVGGDAAAAIVAARPEDGFEDFGAIRAVEGVGDWEAKLLVTHAGAMKVPFVVLWLVLGALFFTFRYGFPNIRALGHAVQVTRGVYDDEESEGEVSHFQALSSALSATVGLGNIAGVAVAVGMGGPGAVFWMVVAAFFGMCSKFSECTLGQLYRQTDAKGHVSGGPMRYLAAGLEEMGMKPFGKVLSVAFALMCIGGSLGGGNMFQANQSGAQISQVVPLFEGSAGRLVYGLVLAIFVGAVIIGGIKRIGKVAGLIVPVMCGVYVLAGFGVLFSNLGEIGPAFGKIFGEAFSPDAVAGGFFGVLMIGFQRAAFSNEAGVGSASIAHSAASTDEPVREGIVALLEPFIDTIIVCTMTGLVVVITGAYQSGQEGVEMTSTAFNTVIPGFEYVLSFAVVMFAFSTMISWSYYGERCWTFLFGTGSSMIYKVIFLIFSVLGAIIELGNVITFSDLMILGMAFPNILGMYFLSGKVKRAFDDYWKRLKSGEMQPRTAVAKAEAAEG
ncbi:MAG: alanine glycine permease [Sandaracinus sp.]|nr:alanine glycine permease [Myxococcales bacterium]MAT28677.1 alanine glycine permease [Sandaracinus sp.]MBJ75067.1 alanine glycine permease [Sandaracinus sp.]